MDTKIGVYICKGCDIAASMDIDKILEAGTEQQAAVCKAHDCLCSPEGVQMIRDEIKSENLNRVVVGACSLRVFPELFDFGKEIAGTLIGNDEFELAKFHRRYRHRRDSRGTVPREQRLIV